MTQWLAVFPHLLETLRQLYGTAGISRCRHTVVSRKIGLVQVTEVVNDKKHFLKADMLFADAM
ncbi:MAG TPA: hypothetical protein VJB18_03440 [Burkholderiales bacterium]|nr:hypothetical protein [Burkholderiales bacterium]